MVISSLVTSPVEDQLNHCEIPEHTHTRHQAGQPRAACGVYATEGEEGGESSLQARTAGGRSIDIVMLITPHIYRSSESIGGGRGRSRSAASKRRGWDGIGPYLAIWSNIWAERLLNVHPLPTRRGRVNLGGMCARSAGRCALSYCTPTTIPSPVVVRCLSVLDVMNKGGILRHIFHALGRLTKGLRKVTNVRDAMKCTYILLSIAKVFHLSECDTAPSPSAAYLLIPSV